MTLVKETYCEYRYMFKSVKLSQYVLTTCASNLLQLCNPGNDYGLNERGVNKILPFFTLLDDGQCVQRVRGKINKMLSQDTMQHCYLHRSSFGQKHIYRGTL